MTNKIFLAGSYMITGPIISIVVKLMLWFFLISKKAFYTVDHDILLFKTNLYEIQGFALDWFRSYLTIVHNEVSLMVPFLGSVHLNAGYLREQFLAPFYFLFTSTIYHIA